MDAKKIELSIDGRNVSAFDGATILEACALAGVKVPSLCRLEGVCTNASCGVCVVEVEGARSLVRSCVQKAAAGMVVRTSGSRVMNARRGIVELLLANHPADCLSCIRSGSCELQSLAETLGVRRAVYPSTRQMMQADEGDAIIRDNAKCVLCGRCVAVCRDVQGVSAIDFAGRGAKTRIVPYLDKALDDSVCVSCGQCTLVCPTGALVERDQSDEVFEALQDPEKIVIVQTAPAIRASLGEALGMESGSLVTGKMAAALRRLGFAKVFDTQFTADLTIMEEGSELIERLSGGVLPMISSCSPGWINFIETFYPDLLPHLSTCKSPQQMFGALAKSWWARENNVDPSRLVVVSIMPCTAKKKEACRPEMRDAWHWWKKEEGKKFPEFFDVDFALTTRELARMVRRSGIDFEKIPEEGFDSPLGISTGAAVIFAATGGVMEAAARTAFELVNGKPLPGLEVAALRGLSGIKTVELPLGKAKARFAVAHTLKNARILLDEIKSGKSPYAFIEIMSCPGGCVGGGGQPILPDDGKRLARQSAVYTEDRKLPERLSHKNEAVSKLYADFLGKPLSEVSHELLHTHYSARRV